MISEDLASLFGAGPAGPTPDSSLRQGVLTSFDPATGNNTVQIGTSTLTNVPLLLTGSETGLASGQNVILMQIGNTYCIMGRIATPGSGSFASASIATQEVYASASGFGVSTIPDTVLCSTTVEVPSWANRMSAVCESTYNAYNNYTADIDMYVDTYINGSYSGSGGSAFYGHLHSRNGSSVGNAVTQTVTPGSTVEFRGVGWSAVNLSADASNRAVLNGIAIFTKV